MKPFWLSALIAFSLAACGGSDSGSQSTYTIGGTAGGLVGQVTLLNNGDNPLTITANGSIVFTTPVAYNSSYAVTVGTQPTGQICTVSNGSGSGVVANITNVTVTCRNKQYAYVTNSAGNTVSMFAIGSNGILSPLATPTIAAGTGPSGIAISP